MYSAEIIGMLESNKGCLTNSPAKSRPLTLPSVSYLVIQSRSNTAEASDSTKPSVRPSPQANAVYVSAGCAATATFPGRLHAVVVHASSDADFTEAPNSAATDSPPSKCMKIERPTLLLYSISASASAVRQE